MLPTVEESRGYDFQDPENSEKWRGMFINSLKKVIVQVHPSLTADESALQYVETLLFRLLSMLCAPPSPLTVQDVEERVARTFPTPIDKWALADARDAIAQKRRRGLLPTDKVHVMLKEVLQYKLDTTVSVFITAVLEYISCDLLKLAGNFVKKINRAGHEAVSCRDVETAMCADKVLQDMFCGEWEPRSVAQRRADLTYGDLVRDLMTEEKQFLRELNLIIRVFKEELEKILDHDSKKISLIFGNIMDIYELTVTLLGNLEDCMEVSEGTEHPYVGSCFEELAEVEEFKTYVRYAKIVTSKESKDALQSIVDDPVLGERLDTAGHGFRLAVKYFLPRLLLAPLNRALRHHECVLALHNIAGSNDDKESFKQVECNLLPIKKAITKILGNGPQIEGTLPSGQRVRRQQAIDKCAELSRLVENWDTRDTAQCCTEFIREDTLTKIGPGKRTAERRAYLFDGMLLLCKPATSLVVGSVGSSSGMGALLKLKEKLHLRRLEVVDRPDTEEGVHLIELVPRAGPAVLLAAASAQDKRGWMCDLVMLNTNHMLERTLDSILLDLERKHPLKLPPPEIYRFAVPDSPDNIVFEERRGNAPAPLIKGATLIKLVERLTYHIYADLGLVRTFLTTYRSFCSPKELLTLLIERFRIPDPQPDINDGVESSATSDAEKLAKNTSREDWKRYRKEFQQPVKFRVINVIRHWVDQHFYDFERDPELLTQLREFLLSVQERPMRKWVASVLKTLTRKSSQPPESELAVAHIFSSSPPPVLKHIYPPAKCDWHPLALHPLELARQLTLLHFSVYRLVKPSELVVRNKTKEDKERNSPNVQRISKHTTNFTNWIEKWIVTSANIDERVAVVCRFVEVGSCLLELNNFNGVLAVQAALDSAAVHRLSFTFDQIPPRLKKMIEDFQSLNTCHYRKYKEKLRSINPPCVPFFGMYQTNIEHIEVGNTDYLGKTELINFSKRRKVAEITGEVQQYQNQPYCLTVEPETRAFLENLDPFPGKDEVWIANYLYERCLEIEPRDAKLPPKFPRKYPQLSLKPVKVSKRLHDQSAAGSDDNVSQLSPPGAWETSSVYSLALTITTDDARSICGEITASSPRENNRSSISKDDPTSPRDGLSPRHDRCPSLSPAFDLDGKEGETNEIEEELPPLLPRSAAPPDRDPARSPPERPPPSPAHRARPPQRIPGVSPKRSPAPAPPTSPNSDKMAFNFPSKATPPPITPPPPVPAPPLPPRRRPATPRQNRSPPSLLPPPPLPPRSAPPAPSPRRRPPPRRRPRCCAPPPPPCCSAATIRHPHRIHMTLRTREHQLN